MKWKFVIPITGILILILGGLVLYKPEITKQIPLLQNLLPEIISASSSQTAIYTFTDKTNNKAYNSTGNSNWTAATLLTTGAELPSAGYTNLETNNNQNATIKSGASNDFVMFRYVFDLNQSASAISLLNVTWIGSRTPTTYTDAEVPELRIYNWTSNAWNKFATIGLQKGTNTSNYSGANIANYVGSTNNNVTIVAWNLGGLADSGEGIANDFIKLDITYTDNNPTWNSNTTNGTLAGSYVLHSVNLTDDISLSGYIFSFDNGTGTFVNDTFVTSSGTQAWANVSKWINTTGSSTIGWIVYTNDSSNNWNSTSIFQYTTTAIPNVIINFPQNTTYYRIQDMPFTFNVSLNENGSVMYSIDNETDNVIANTTMSSLDNQNFNSTLDDIIPGNYTFNVYANDTAGNDNYTQSVTFILLQRRIIINGTVVNSSGDTINTTLIITDEANQSILYNNTNETNDQIIVPLNSTYTIQVNPLEIQSVNSVVFTGLDFSGTDDKTTDLVRIDEVNNTNSSQNSTFFAVNPLVDNFISAQINFTANGNSLYKCDNWNFTEQACDGNWSLYLLDLNVGKSYVIPIYNESRGFSIINISKADHLNSTRGFISDIYPQVETLDDIWSETIPSDDYIRVVFEEKLTNNNDITIYPRTISGTPFIEVYEKDQNDSVIANFSSITDNQYNQVLLTNLNDSQDTFDLKVSGGSVQFDHIVDPRAQTTSTTVTNYTANGTFNVPANVNNITVEAWGGGGAGGSASRLIGAGGGGAGGYSRSNLSSNEGITAGSSYTVTVAGIAKHNGTTNTNGTQGQNTSFAFTNGTNMVLAVGGNFGMMGSMNNSIGRGGVGGQGGLGQVIYVGGWGANGSGLGVSGAGGGGAGSTGAGGNASNITAGTGTAEFGATGGAGRTSNGNGANGTNRSGGGGGARGTSTVGGWGAAGLVSITYTIPQWSSNTTNGTKNGTYILHSVNISDDLGVNGYIFSFDNGTGTFVNDTFVTSSGTQAWANVSKWINNTAGSTIRWWIWFNNSANNFNYTGVSTYTANTDTCTYTSGNWNINCADFCNITSNTNGGGNNITFGGTGSVDLEANLTNFVYLIKDNACSLIKSNSNYMQLG